ncbi:EpsG family protein [Vibrio alginolyticus]|uniref:EpsG family protein n=3 Tax=Vibrionaceae TaxID=641 RepID=UPI001427FAFC|nr:EpsG family protein [Vibrio alginolyticus]QIR94422.1 EpsG family protein [Vibrio alginolyticus]
MNIYIVFSLSLSLIALLHVKSKEYKKLNELYVVSFMFLFSMVVGVSSIMGWREITHMKGGIDTIVYQEIFNVLLNKDISSVNEQRIEFGYALLMWLSKSIVDNFNFFLFIFSVSILTLYLKICNVMTKNVFSIVSYFAISLFVIDSFNISRMILSVFILFFIIPELRKENYLRAILIVLLSTSIQMTGLWGLVIIFYYYFMYSLTNKKTIRFLMFLLGSVLSYGMVFVFKAMLMKVGYSHYVDDEGGASYLNYIYLAVILFISFVFKFDKFVDETNAMVVLRILPSMFFIIPLYTAIPIAYRFNLFYILLFFFILPDLCKFGVLNVKKLKLYYFPFIFIPLLYAGLKFFSYFQTSVNSALLWNVSNSWYLF